MTFQAALAMLFWLLVAHALCDYPLQGDFLARAKNHRDPIPGVPAWVPMVAHSLIHGGAVAFITGSVALGTAETLFHAWIDYDKCEGRHGFAFDQACHVACKLFIILAVLLGLGGTHHYAVL